jgi:hypothetical protein
MSTSTPYTVFSFSAPIEVHQKTEQLLDFLRRREGANFSRSKLFRQLIEREYSALIEGKSAA